MCRRVVMILVAFVLVVIGINVVGGLMGGAPSAPRPQAIATEDMRSELEQAIDGVLNTNLRAVHDNDFVNVSFDTRSDVSFAEYQIIQMLCAGREYTDKDMQFSAFMLTDADERINGLTVEMSAEMINDFPCDASGQLELRGISEAYDLNPAFR